MHQKRLSDLGFEKEINRALSRFREKVQAYFPHAQKQSDGKNKIMVFERDIQEVLKQVTMQDHEADVVLLAKAAKIVQKDIASYKGFAFDSKFPRGCQQELVPSCLKI